MSDITPNPSAQLDELRAQAQNLQRLNAMIDRRMADDALATATAGTPFVSEAAREQAIGILRQQIKVEDDGVRSTDGRSVGAFVADQLRGDKFAHFLKSRSSHGGTAHPGGNPGALAPSQFRQDEPTVEPRTLGEHLMMRSRQAHMERETRLANGNPARDLSLPFGLGPIRR